MSTLALRRRRAAALPGDAALTVLVLATVLATVWAVIAGGWNDGMTLALLTTSVAVVEAALIAASGASRWFALLQAPLLGVLVIVPLTSSGMPPKPGGTLADAVGTDAHALLLGMLGNESWPFIVGFCAATWTLGFWAGWLALRERNGVLAVMPCYGVLAANALNAPSLGAVAFPESLAVAASLLVIGRSHLAELEAAWLRRRVIALPGTRARFLGMTGVAATAVVLVALILPPLTTVDQSGRLFHLGLPGSGPGGPGGTEGGLRETLVPGTVSFSADVDPGGPLVDRPVLVLKYTTDYPAGVYLRVVDDVRFVAGSWLPSDYGARGASVVSSPPATIPRDPDPSHGGSATLGPHRLVHLHVDLASPDAASSVGTFFAGEPEAVGGDVTISAFGLDAATDYGIAGPDLVTVDRVQAPGLYLAGVAGSGRGDSVASVSTATEAQLRAAGTAYPAWIDEGGLRDLGPDASSRQLADIRTLARSWAAGRTDPYDMARALEAHLRSGQFSYTLSPPAAPAGEWPIHFFLTHSHAGYCQYYASSLGIMLRLLGVPARLVSGFGSGTDYDERGRPTSVSSVSTSDAHVWVEAYFPGYGWIPFEPTPSSAQGTYDVIQRPAPGQDVPAQTLSPTPAAPTPTPEATPSATPAPAGSGASTVPGSGMPPVVAAAAVGVIALLVLAVTAAVWLRRPGDAPALWLRLRVVGRLLGVRRGPAETQAAYLGRLARALPPDSASLLHPHGGPIATGRRVSARSDEALAVLATLGGKAAFSAQGLTPAERVRGTRAWSRLCSALPTLLWRRMLARLPSLPRRLGA